MEAYDVPVVERVVDLDLSPHVFIHPVDCNGARMLQRRGSAVKPQARGDLAVLTVSNVSSFCNTRVIPVLPTPSGMSRTTR
eukprot:scaffold179_cov368-Prasinococcus_capsulatus_cf.AAC.14